MKAYQAFLFIVAYYAALCGFGIFLGWATHHLF